MQSAIERRLGILEYLCKQRRDTIENLAFEFGVSRSTIKRDIEILSISYPLSTSQGKGGGVYVAEWFKFGMVYLTDKQAELLKRLDKYLVGELGQNYSHYAYRLIPIAKYKRLAAYKSFCKPLFL